MSRSKKVVPGRIRVSNRVHTTRDLRILLAWGSGSVKIPAGTEGIVVSRARGGNIYLRTLMGKVVEHCPSICFEIHFPDMTGLDEYQICRKGGTRVWVTSTEFLSGDLAKGRA